MDEKEALTGSEGQSLPEPEEDGVIVESNRDADPAPEPEKETEEQAAEAKPEGEPDADAESEGEEAQPEPAPEPRKQSRAQKRFDKLTEQRYKAEQEAAEWKREAKRARERLAKYETPKPQASDFEDPDEYTAALAAYNVQQATKQEREDDATDAENRAKEADTAALKAAAAAFEQRAEEFAKGVPDYYEVTTDDAVHISEGVAMQLIRMEKGPQIAYYLGKHKSEANVLSLMDDPVDVARELGRLEGRLTAPPPKRVTSAPAPVEAIASGSTGAGKSFDPATASVDEMEAHLRERKPHLFG